MCKCSEYSDVHELWDDAYDEFTGALDMIAEIGDRGLFRCSQCSTHWQVDTGRGKLAIRIADPDSWSEFDDNPIRMKQMIDYHGGLGDQTCQWRGCSNKVLKDMALCPDHVYPMLVTGSEG